LEIVFLYNRLYSLSKKQLDALKSRDLDLMERLTDEREELTGKICNMIANSAVDLENNFLNLKVHEITEMIMEVDEEIKNSLLEELLNRTLEISSIDLVEE
jgi:hypothetical protein